jgi:hypothetical protein
MTKVKKAQAGVGLKRRQYKRLGRIAEKNTERAKEVAERMKERATRYQRGKELAGDDAGAKVRKAMEEAKAASKAKNGKSFPDLNKDGKITKADILKGRGVIKNGGKIKKAQAGLTASNKRVGPVDPNGAWTKVQEMNLPPKNVKTKVSLTKNKQLGATKMKMGGGLKPVDKAKNPGLSKLPTPVRNKMGYQKNGGKTKKK